MTTLKTAALSIALLVSFVAYSATAFGQTKTVTTKYGNKRTVPASYPGAAGRIRNREARHPYTTPGKAAGQISSIGPSQAVTHNVGVRWRHPGLMGRHFLQEGITQAANANGVYLEGIMARHNNGSVEMVAT